MATFSEKKFNNNRPTLQREKTKKEKKIRNHKGVDNWKAWKHKIPASGIEEKNAFI